MGIETEQIDSQVQLSLIAGELNQVKSELLELAENLELKFGTISPDDLRNVGNRVGDLSEKLEVQLARVKAVIDELNEWRDAVIYE